jgi:hypothetical protein
MSLTSLIRLAPLLPSDPAVMLALLPWQMPRMPRQYPDANATGVDGPDVKQGNTLLSI